MRSIARSSILGCLAASVGWTVVALAEQPVTFYSATPGKPVIAATWADVQKLAPKGWPGKWNGTPCGSVDSIADHPIEFHRPQNGRIFASVLCYSIGGELWASVGRNFEIVPLPVPAEFPGGGFALRRNTGIFIWNAESSAFTVTTSSDALPYMAQRMTYAVGSSVQSIRLVRVDSALDTGRNRDNLQWETEWEAKPWRAAPRDPLFNP